MNARASIQAVLRGERPARIPLDLWVTPEIQRDLERVCGTTAWERALGVDRLFWVGPAYPFSPELVDTGTRRTPWGVRLRPVRSGAAVYEEVDERPLAGLEDPRALDDYPWWPDPELCLVEDGAARARAITRGGHATLGPWISVFEIYCGMRGLEDAFVDVAEDTPFLHAALDRIWAIQTRMLERFLEAAGDALDVVFISDDMGSQESLLVSVPTWERLFRDKLRAWCDLIHRHGRSVMFHTDGAVRPLVPHLIAAGVDVLNPIQHRCAGMERDALERDFGERLIFYGGLENQRVLPFGNDEEVREETLACLDILGRRRRYICCSCHNVQAGTPVRNLLTVIDCVRQFNGEPSLDREFWKAAARL